MHGIQQQSTNSQTRNNERYHIIQSLLDRYQRNFTMLDIGARQGYYSLRTAHDYNSVCVMTEKNDTLLEICKAHPELNNIILLNTQFTPNTLKHLGECEHFDVILALHVRNEFGEQWKEALDALFTLGDHLIVEVGPDDNDMQKYIVTNRGQVIGKTSTNGHEYRSTLYHVKTSNNYLRRKTWLWRPMDKDSYYIESSFTNKQLQVSSEKGTYSHTTTWLAGINLCTFKMCHGVYPTSKQLKNELLTVKDATHTDWMINNMIIQGTTLALIDGDSQLHKNYFSGTRLQAHKEILDLNEPEKVEHYFWHKLIYVPIVTRPTIKFFNQLFPACSLVFDICSPNNFFIDKYLGYGTQVICYNPNSKYIGLLQTTSMTESLTVITDDCCKEKVDTNIGIDNLIKQFGMPSFCNIHVEPDLAYEYIQTISQPIECVAYKFDIRYKTSLIRCLEHLVSLGYSQFNFSSRNIPHLALEHNWFNGVHKEWVNSVDELLHELDEFKILDYDADRLWGYIYARN